MDRPLPFKVLRRILRSYDVVEKKKRGKGSHTWFERQIDGGIVGLAVPTNNDPVLQCYVKQIRRRFLLTPGDGVSDEEFYSRG